jgi:hypothetical protein
VIWIAGGRFAEVNNSLGTFPANFVFDLKAENMAQVSLDNDAFDGPVPLSWRSSSTGGEMNHRWEPFGAARCGARKLRL